MICGFLCHTLGVTARERAAIKSISPADHTYAYGTYLQKVCSLAILLLKEQN